MKNLTLIVPILAMTALSAQAQSRMEDSTMQIKEVVISTTRIPEIRSNSASTVTIIDHQQIVEMSKIAPDMSKILGLLTPGMALSSNTTSSRSQSLRSCRYRQLPMGPVAHIGNGNWRYVRHPGKYVYEYSANSYTVCTQCHLQWTYAGEDTADVP